MARPKYAMGDTAAGDRPALATHSTRQHAVAAAAALGVALGVRRSRAAERAEAMLAKRRRPVGVVVLAVVVVALAAVVARPTRTTRSCSTSRADPGSPTWRCPGR